MDFSAIAKLLEDKSTALYDSRDEIKVEISRILMEIANEIRDQVREDFERSERISKELLDRRKVNIELY